MTIRKTFQELLKAVKANKATALGAKRFILQNDDIKILAKALENNTTLKVLKLASNTIKNAGVQHIANGLKSNTTLKALDLSYNIIGDAGVQHLAEALENNNSLQELNLSHNEFADAGARHLAEALKTNTSLRSLNLIHNDIGDAGVQHLAEALENNNSLQELNLSHNEFADAGAQHFAEALKTNTSLQSLNLKECFSITEVGAQHLLKALETNTSLQVLLLTDYQINPETLKKIEFKTAFNKHLYDSTKYFINKLFNQYEKLSEKEKIDIDTKPWLEDAIYSNSTNQPKDTSKYVFKPIGKVKLLEFFIKHPSPAQFIFGSSPLALADFTKTFQDFKKDLTASYHAKYFYFNSVCKPFKGGDDLAAVQSISKDTDNNNNNSQAFSIDDEINSFSRVCKSFKVEDDLVVAQLTPKDINCNNNNSQKAKESNENIFNLLPNGVFPNIIDLFTLDGSSINHSAQGNLDVSTPNAVDTMDNTGEGDKSELIA